MPEVPGVDQGRSYPPRRCIEALGANPVSWTLAGRNLLGPPSVSHYSRCIVEDGTYGVTLSLDDASSRFCFRLRAATPEGV